MTTTMTSPSPSGNQWVRIPDGTKVRHRTEAYEGVIDGLTEIVSGTDRNPDQRTQYRVKLADSTRMLVSEDHLNILLDNDHLVIVSRESDLYRQNVTDRMRRVFGEDRFVAVRSTGPSFQRKKSASKD